MTEMPEHQPWGRRIVAIALVMLGTALVLQTSLALAWSRTNPLLATRISPGNGVALNWLANFRMLTAQSDADMQAVLDTAKMAAARAPLEAEAVRSAGFVIAARGDEAKADRIIGLAAKISKRDYFSHAWLLDRKFRLNRVDGAVEEADIVLRQRVSSWPVILPELARITSDHRVIEPLAQTLATKPYWRGSFLEALGTKGSDQGATYALYRRLVALKAPATTLEQQSWFYRFDGKTDALTWYQRWLSLLPKPLPAGNSLVRDGGFEGLDAPAPFNWRFYPKDGTYAELSKNPDGPGKSLYLSFEGTRATDFAVQSLILPPGNYVLSAKVFADDSIDKGKIGLSISCGTFVARERLGKLDFAPVSGRWTTQKLVVTVPAGCASPQLWFTGEQGNALTPATLWVDDVTIRPTTAQPPKPGPAKPASPADAFDASRESKASLRDKP